MGADFLLYDLPIQVFREEALARLHAMDRERLVSVLFDNGPSEWNEDFDEWVERVDENEQELRERAVKYVEGLLDWVYGVADGSVRSREIDWRIVDGYKWLFTGGMSWGDPPTDASETFRLLRELDLTTVVTDATLEMEEQ